MSQENKVEWCRPNEFTIYIVPFVIFFGVLLSIAGVRNALKSTDWSLADALSEEVQLPSYKTTIDADGKSVKTLEYDNEGKVVLVAELRASSSRLIALMGMIVILFMFVGFGVFALFSYGNIGKLPASIDAVVKFLGAGVTLFAPYLVNKFTSIFQGVTR